MDKIIVERVKDTIDELAVGFGYECNLRSFIINGGDYALSASDICGNCKHSSIDCDCNRGIVDYVNRIILDIGAGLI